MKFTKVMKLVKQSKSATFMQVEETVNGETYRRGPQWVSNGGAAYCLEGAPVIRSENEFFTAYDVKEKQQENFYIKFTQLPDFIRRIERWNGSCEATAQKLTVSFEDMEPLRGFQYGADEMMLVRARDLEPFQGEENQYLEYVVRHDDGMVPFLCVYDGMDVKAVILPFRFKGSSPIGDALYYEIGKFQYELFRQLNGKACAEMRDDAVMAAEEQTR